MALGLRTNPRTTSVRSHLTSRRTIGRSLRPSSLRYEDHCRCQPDDFQHLVIFSDSLLCVTGANDWMTNWEVGGWSRRGKPIVNVDLWRVLKRAKAALPDSNIKLSLRHVPAHVGSTTTKEPTASPNVSFPVHEISWGTLSFSKN